MVKGTHLRREMARMDAAEGCANTRILFDAIHEDLTDIKEHLHRELRQQNDVLQKLAEQISNQYSQGGAFLKWGPPNKGG